VAGAQRARPRAAADPQTLASLAATLARALSAGVIVTNGSSGSAASIGELSVAVPAYAADAPVVDSTGAGDAYAAAVIGALAGRGWPPSADALRAAMLAGSELGSRVARVTGAQGVVLGERQPTMPR
jgi:sugar/nucleoside kinase (ribokinase family)